MFLDSSIFKITTCIHNSLSIKINLYSYGFKINNNNFELNDIYYKDILLEFILLSLMLLKRFF